MRISRRKRFFRPQNQQQIHFRINEQIRAPEVRVIDENDVNLGILPSWQAVKEAEARGLDLVEVNPKGDVPTCKLMEYGQFKYEKEKELKKQKQAQKTMEIKGIRLSARIGQHDLDVKKERAKEFFEKGHKVQIEIILRGREKRFTNLAKDVINQFIKNLDEEIGVKPEQPISVQGGKLSVIVAKK
jgi:translation initiation factor IF-3